MYCSHCGCTTILCVAQRGYTYLVWNELLYLDNTTIARRLFCIASDTSLISLLPGIMSRCRSFIWKPRFTSRLNLSSSHILYSNTSLIQMASSSLGYHGKEISVVLQMRLVVSMSCVIKFVISISWVSYFAILTTDSTFFLSGSPSVFVFAITEKPSVPQNK